MRDECRATVALSRAKHGLFLIGDIETLKGGKVWNRFISRASDFTQVVGPEYLKVLRSESFKRDRFGQLLDAGGKMIANFVDEVPQQQQHASTSAGRRQVETWRQPGQPGPSTSNNSRVEDWFEFNLNDNKLKTHTNKSNFRKRQAPEDWRQWQGTTFARTEQSKCFTCGRYGHFARECTENRGPWRSDSWRGGRGKY